MASRGIDIIARLQLRAEQFSSEVGRAMGDAASRARTASDDFRSTWSSALSDVQRLSSTALNLNRTSKGTLDLSNEIQQLQNRAVLIEQNSIAQREMSVALTAASNAAGVDAQQLRLEADAAAVAALALEREVGALRDRASVLGIVQIELDKTISATDRNAAASARDAAAAGQRRASMVNLGQQFGDFAVQVAGGQSAFIAFAQQAPQAAFALQGFGGSLGAVGEFLTGPWGIALTIGAVALTPLLQNLFDTKKAAEEAKKAEQAYAEFQADLGNYIDKANGKLREKRDLLAQIAVLENKDAITSKEKEVNALSKQAFDAATAGAIKGYNYVERQARAPIYDPQISTVISNANGNPAALEKGLIALSKTRPDVEKLATEVGRLVGKASQARIEADKLRGTTSDLATALGGGIVMTTDMADRQVALANATTAVEKAQARLNEVRARASAIDDMNAGPDKAKALRQYSKDLDGATKALKAAQTAATAEKQGVLTAFLMPVTGPISSKYGQKRSYETHPGVDIAVPVGTPVKAPAGGTVDFTGGRGALGNTVIINFGAGLEGRFGHLSKFTVKPGDVVNAGDIIGYSGGAKGAEGAGNSTGPHLHYELRRGGKSIDPTKGAYATDATGALADADRRQQAASRAAKEFADSQQRAADQVFRINASWDEQPRLIDRARIETRKLDEIAKQYRGNTDAISKEIVANAEAAKRAITDGLNRPFNDYIKSQREGLEIQHLVLAGYDVEATALQEALRIQQQQGFVTETQLASIRDMAVEQERIRRALEDQRQIVSVYSQFVGGLRRDFGQFQEDLETKGIAAFPKLLSNAFSSYKQLSRDLVANMIFGGIDRDVDTYVRKMTGKRTPAEILVDDATDAGSVLKSSFGDAGDAAGTLAQAFLRASGQLSLLQPDLGIGTPAAGVTSGGPITEIVGDMQAFLDQGLKALDRSRPHASNDNDAGLHPHDILITASRSLEKSGGVIGVIIGRLDSNLRTLGVKLPRELTNALKEHGDEIARGALAGQLGGSIFASITGGKTNSTASAIGGALGEVGGKAIGKTLSTVIGGTLGKTLGGAAGPIGSVVGGILGNVVAGLFKSTPKGQAGVTVNQYGKLGAGTATGNAVDAKSGASTLAGSVATGLQRIAEQLGAQVTGKTDVQIGTYDGKYRVNDHGGAIGGVSGSGALGFGTDAEAAIAYAISDALKDGVLSGISKAALNILRSGQDLDTAIQKALLIENIPHDLKAMLDPVGSAIDDFNKKWQKTVDALKEGGATTDQLAQAQQLYDLQLAQVKQSTSSASQSLKDFLVSLKIGSNSPYSLRDQESTARAQLQPFLDTIAAGGSIDQSKYQDSAKAFLDIERQLYGSTQQYFDVMDQIQSATNAAISAIDNATPITPGVPDPFTKATSDAVQTNNEIAAQQSDLLVQAVDLLSQIAANNNGDISDFLGTGRGFVKTG